jgi:hypothetical protein
MVNWKTGDRVKCVDMKGRSLSHEPFLHLNETYTYKKSPDHNWSIINSLGIERSGYFLWRFKKMLPELPNNIQVL